MPYRACGRILLSRGCHVGKFENRLRRIEEVVSHQTAKPTCNIKELTESINAWKSSDVVLMEYVLEVAENNAGLDDLLERPEFLDRALSKPVSVDVLDYNAAERAKMASWNLPEHEVEQLKSGLLDWLDEYKGEIHMYLNTQICNQQHIPGAFPNVPDHKSGEIPIDWNPDLFLQRWSRLKKAVGYVE